LYASGGKRSPSERLNPRLVEFRTLNGHSMEF
jgi:hypothetical protein